MYKSDPRRTFDGTDHGAVAGPLLRISQVRDRVQVCGNEKAARVLPDAERGHLDLVIVDVAVEADNDSTDLHRFYSDIKPPHSQPGQRASSQTRSNQRWRSDSVE
eukprot:scaffold24566_cov34-Prasinocladus_malaysianus.AAC.1